MSMKDVVNLLEDYPVGRDQSLPGHEYIGKDYVVGFCDEFIQVFTLQLAKSQKKPIRDTCSEIIKLFQTIRRRRLNKIKIKKMQKHKPIPIAFTKEQEFENTIKETLF